MGPGSAAHRLALRCIRGTNDCYRVACSPAFLTPLRAPDHVRMLLITGTYLMRRARIIFLSLALCWLIVPGFADLAAAQQPAQEKRVALVVGDGNYEKAPLATAANDAGLIAQTLQAAGFDVIGARDLDADGLRNSLRDFMEKVQADPANTVAMIYLSGYGIQLAGENYFIPVDSKIGRDTDIPTEGLRISDYTRQLASLSVK